MSRVVCFGEIMMRLAPPDYQRFVQARAFDIIYGGGEANVAVSLANFGIEASFVTRLPDNPLGDSCLAELRRFGVDTADIVRGGDRLGLYFLERGMSMRPSKVIYDRKNSSLATAHVGDIDWERAFTGVDWFHFTGITPALGANTAELTKEACMTAKRLGLTISCDLNYRKTLWRPEEACWTMGELMAYVDIAIANEEDAEMVFGIKADESDITGGHLSDYGYANVALQLAEKFQLKKVGITLRESISASDNVWSGLFYDGAGFYKSKKYDIHIVDRVGGGDAFAAGIIYGILNDHEPQATVEFAVAASALKHTIEGDFNHVGLDDVMSLVHGNASGRIVR